MHKRFWRQFVLFVVLLAIMATTSAWAAPGIPPGSSSPDFQGIVTPWLDALSEWFGWSSWQVEGGSEQTARAATQESQVPEPDPTVWNWDASADAGPSLDPDG